MPVPLEPPAWPLEMPVPLEAPDWLPLPPEPPVAGGEDRVGAGVLDNTGALEEAGVLEDAGVPEELEVLENAALFEETGAGPLEEEPLPAGWTEARARR